MRDNAGRRGKTRDRGFVTRGDVQVDHMSCPKGGGGSGWNGDCVDVRKCVFRSVAAG